MAAGNDQQAHAGGQAATWGTLNEQQWPAVKLTDRGHQRPPELEAITTGLMEYGRTLRELGHAHAKLDANAREMIARIALAYLEAWGFTIVGPEAHAASVEVATVEAEAAYDEWAALPCDQRYPPPAARKEIS